MSSQAVFYSVASVLVIIVAIMCLWFLLWKFVLEPNPLIRDFFDLDVREGKIKKAT